MAIENTHYEDTAFADSLGPSDPRSNTVHVEPDFTSVIKDLT